MKKQLFIIPCLFMGLLLWQGCSKEETSSTPPPETPSISIDTDNETPVFDTAGGSCTLTFTATADWTANISQAASDWINISPSSGKAGTYTVYITVQENEDYDERNASITLTSGSTSHTFTVTQKQKDALILTSNKVELEAGEKDFTVELQSNVTVTYEIGAEAQTWLTPASDSRGLTSKTLTFHADENTNTEPRQGIITLHGGNQLVEEITVYQAGDTPTLVLTQSEYMVGSDGETIKVELRSNSHYEIEMPNADWITENTARSISTYTHYFTIAPNETYDSRNAEINFIDKENGLKQTVSITQMQKDAIILAQDIYEMPAEGGALDFVVQTNIDFNVIISSEWITQTEGRSRGLVEKTLHFNIAANNEESSREATITIWKDQVNQTVTVKQAGKKEEIKPFLQLSTYAYSASSEGETFDVKVQTNIDYRVEIQNADWITDYGSYDGIRTFRVLPNETDDVRTAYILFINEEYGFEERLVVTQEKQEQEESFINIPQSLYEMTAEGGSLDFTVSSNVTFDIEVNVNWLRLKNGTTGAGDNRLTFEADKNTTTDTREAVITFTAEDGYTQTVRVIQEGIEAPYLNIIQTVTEKLSADKQVISIQTESNITDFAISIEDQEWISLANTEYKQNADGSTSFTYTFTVSANQTYDARSNRIEISNTTYGLSKTITIEQEGQKKPEGVTGTGNEPYDKEEGNWDVI